jgi:hypothetical protein
VTGSAFLRARALLGLVAVCLGCAHARPARVEVDLDRGPAPWTSLALRDAPEDFRFVLVADRTGGHREGVFERSLEQIERLAPAFVLSVGDLIEGYSRDRAELAAMWDELEGLVARLEAPFFYAPGNHDYSNETMARVWRERFGPSYYHFRYKGVLFLVLNSELFSSVANPGHPVPGPDTQAAQLRYAERVLRDHRDARWTILVVHQPLWDQREVPADWLALERWLGDRPYTVFAGHVHRYTHELRRDRRYVTLATTGGRSRLRGLEHGEFDHVVQVSLTDRGPVVANLLLDGIQGERVRTRELRDRRTALERAISAEPFPAEDGFARGRARFTVANDTGSPLAVEGRVGSGPDLFASPRRLSRTLAPGASHTFELAVETREAKPVGAMAPAEVAWTLRGEKPDGSPLEIERSSWVLPERRFACPPAPLPVEVDGVLSEWKALPFRAESRPLPPDSPRGSSFRFGVAHDEQFLYVAVDATDPTPFWSAARTPREQDAIVVELDARPESQRAANEGFSRAQRSGTLESLLLAWLLPGATRADPRVGGVFPGLPPGTRRAARTTDTGYAAELAVPMAFLVERQSGPWTGFRLNVSLQDYDARGERHVTHWWRPSRFGFTGVPAAPGAGTFRKTFGKE